MQNLFSLIEETTDGVMAVDQDQRIVHCNKALGEVLGVEPDCVLGEHCYEVMAGRDETGRPHCRKNCRTMLMVDRGQLVPTQDIRSMSNGDNAVWLNVSTILLPPKWRHRCVLFHIVRDVSRKKQVERDVDQLLACANRLMLVQQEGNSGIDLTSFPSGTDLTNRETEVLRLLAAGTSTADVARELGISAATVRNHVQSILSKLGVHTRLEAVTLAMRNGVLSEH